MNSQQFADEFLPEGYGERDLQLLVQRRITKWGLLRCPAEVNIKTPSTTRHSDLETWWCRYELKHELNYSSLKSALGQLYLYNHYGSKILWFMPKKKCIIGLAPYNEQEYKSALKLAVDIEGMGIKVIFLNEFPNWKESRFSKNHILIIACTITFIAVFTASFLAVIR